MLCLSVKTEYVLQTSPVSVHCKAMTLDVCAEISSLQASPRISFSYDLNQSDDLVPVDLNSRKSDGYDDFNFCISKSFTQELPSADQLFCNGKIAPIQIKNFHHQPNPKLVPHPLPQPTKITDENSTKKKRLKEFLSNSFDPEEEEEEKPFSKSFWKFRRSNSLNCDNGRSRGLIRSLHFLSRSNSTGSAPNTLFQKGNPKQQPQEKKPSMANSKSKPPLSFSTAFNSNSSLKKKNFGSYYGNGVRISPVLNIPPVYIFKGTVNFFGFGSFFCNGKSKKKKR